MRLWLVKDNSSSRMKKRYHNWISILRTKRIMSNSSNNNNSESLWFCETMIIQQQRQWRLPLPEKSERFCRNGWSLSSTTTGTQISFFLTLTPVRQSMHNSKWSWLKRSIPRIPNSISNSESAPFQIYESKSRIFFRKLECANWN